MAENKTTFNVDTKYCEYVLIGDITLNVYPSKDGKLRPTVVASEEEKPADTSKANPEYPRECIVAQKEMDMNAGREENEVHEKSSVLESHPSKSETTVKSKGDTTGSIKRWSLKRLRRLLSKKSPDNNHEVQSEVHSKTNAACTGTLPSSESVPTRGEMCPRCIMTDETDLPQDRNKWPIAQIEKDCFQEICNLLDLYDLSKEPLMIALDCFTTKEVTLITQEFMATRGKGMASKALGIWGTSEDGNNVGTLKDILKNTMERVDVLEKIENWEKLSVCYGCGINLQE
ncbi:Hypothetical predicted protein [Paramuricea clavata]|uniref:Uncharacterized protein n=1 Tax=Paramuricea clavata TaxID=317549 RepID=A0A6S7L706_PARCT|nr:Hypothetical predicted protein [Paramuricea clavata]